MKKEELYKRFGPRLLNSMLEVFRDEINLLRKRQGLAERTEQYIVDSIGRKLFKSKEA